MIHITVLLLFLFLSTRTAAFVFPVDVTVENPPYPTIPNAPLNTDLLNQKAEEYFYDNFPFIINADFVFIYLPVWAFRALADPENQVSQTDIYGILYYAGYWGGIWLRKRLQNRPPAVDPDVVKLNAESNITTAQAAANGPNSLTYIASQLVPAVGSFGYNAGYYRTILDMPPSDVIALPFWDFTYNPNAALNATFCTPQLDLQQIEQGWLNTLNNQLDQQVLKQTCILIQAGSYVVGQGNWNKTTGLNVNGFSFNDYNLLLKASSAFLEIAQYNSVLITQSIGQNSTVRAKIAAVNNGAFLGFNDAYTVGLLNDVYDTSGYVFPSIQVTF